MKPEKFNKRQGWEERKPKKKSKSSNQKHKMSKQEILWLAANPYGE